MDKQVSEHFDEYADKRNTYRDRGKYYHKHIESFIRFLIPKGSNILEIGCGTGETLEALSPEVGTGIDISQRMTDLAKERHPKYEFVKGDAQSVKLGEKYDYALLMNTIGYFEDIQAALMNIGNFIKDDGRLIIVYFSFLWKPILRLAEKIGLRMPGKEKHWLPIDDIENLLRLSGYELIRKERRVLIPFYIPLLSTLANKYMVHLPLIRNVALNTVFVARKKVVNTRKEPIVSVVIPCRNEKGNIESAVKRTPMMGANTELLFVEGGSDDGTYEECLRLRDTYTSKSIRVFQQDGKGKGDAVRKGFGEASGQVLMILDADLTVPPEDLPKFYKALVNNEGEFINGSRLVYNMESEAMRPLNLLGNKFFSWAFSFLLSQKFRDTLCGTKVLWKKDYEKIIEGRSYFGDFDPFGDFDLLFGASKLNLKIVEIPIRYRNREYGETQISRFSHGWLLLKMTLFAMKKIKFI